jgi:hypothetical protein
VANHHTKNPHILSIPSWDKTSSRKILKTFHHQAVAKPSHERFSNFSLRSCDQTRPHTNLKVFLAKPWQGHLTYNPQSTKATRNNIDHLNLFEKLMHIDISEIYQYTHLKRQLLILQIITIIGVPIVTKILESSKGNVWYIQRTHTSRNLPTETIKPKLLILMVSLKQNEAITAAHQILGPGVMGSPRYQQHHATFTSSSRVHKGKRKRVCIYILGHINIHTLKGILLHFTSLNKDSNNSSHNSKHEIHHQTRLINTQWKLLNLLLMMVIH